MIITSAERLIRHNMYMPQGHDYSLTSLLMHKVISYFYIMVHPISVKFWQWHICCCYIYNITQVHI